MVSGRLQMRKIKEIQLLCEAKKAHRYNFWWMMGVFYALFIIRNVLYINFPAVIYLAWVFAMALVFDESEIKSLVISFIPLYPAFQFKYAILICAIVLVLKSFKKFKIEAPLVLILLLMVWELMHNLVAPISLLVFARGFAEFSFIAIALCIQTKEQCSFGEINRVLGISATVAFVILLFYTVQSQDVSLLDLMTSGFRFGKTEELEGGLRFNYNANGVGLICNIVVVALLINIAQKKTKVIEFIILPFAIFVGLLSVSRTYLVCLLITGVLYILFKNNGVIKLIASIISVAFVCMAGYWILKEFFPQIINNYIGRFDVDDVTNGRTYYFDYYNQLLFSPERLFFGIGVQDIAGKAQVMLGSSTMPLVPHNGYQEIVVAWGIIGLLLVATLIFSMIKRAKRGMCNVPRIFYLPMLLLFVNITAGQFVTSGFKILILFYSYEIIVAAKTRNISI